MNNKTLLSLVVGISLVCGVVGAKFFVPLVGGDFAGGIQPTTVLSCNAATNSCTPNLSNFYVNGGVSAGGTAANNQIPVVYTAVATYPGASALTIPSGASPSSSATSTNVAFSAPGFVVGDSCEVQYNFTTSTLITSANVTAVSGSNVTTTASFLNTTGSGVTATVTSTITGASSTVKLTCFATGV